MEKRFCQPVPFHLAIGLAMLASVAGEAAPSVSAEFTLDTPISLASLDSAAFAQYEDGKETPLNVSDGPRHVLWTHESIPGWDGVQFGESKRPGVRHLRIGWKEPIAIGSVLVRCGGQLSVLKPDALYPGDLNDESQWVAAERIKDGRVSCEEVRREEYAVWRCRRGRQRGPCVSRTRPRRRRLPTPVGWAARALFASA